MNAAENNRPQSRVTRRKFIRDSAVVTTTFAATLSPLGELHAAAALAFDSPLYLPPFLARPTGESIFVTALSSDQPCEAVIEIRIEHTDAWERRGAPHKVDAFAMLNWNIDKLSPATHYQYRVLAKRESEEDFAPAANGTFITQRVGPSSYKAILLTDPHTGTFPDDSEPVQTMDKVVANAAKESAEFVLALGDNVAWRDTTAWRSSRVYPQTNTRGAVNSYAMYRKHIAPLTLNCPHFSIIGNWEGESGKFPQQSIELMAQVRKAFTPNPNHETYPQSGHEREDYYAFSWGGVLYVMLNVQTYSKPSNPDQMDSLDADVSSVNDWTIGEEQMTWLEKTLENATEPYRFVCMHHPAGGDAGNPHDTLYGRGGARCVDTGEQVKIHALMKQHKVQIFFYGHDHNFVDDVVDGIHYALPGSYGVPPNWKFTPAETGYERSWPDSGHARLEVTPEKATVTFINVEGEEFHSFSVLPL